MPWRLEYESSFRRKIIYLDAEDRRALAALLDYLGGCEDPKSRGGKRHGGWAYMFGARRVAICQIDVSERTVIFIDIER